MLAACGLAGIILTGCTAESTPAVGTVPPADEVSEPSEPGQPFDIILGRQVGLIDHTHMKIRDRCMAEAGYRQNIDTAPTRPEDPFSFLTVSVRDFGPTSEEEARRAGFGSDTQAAPARVVSTDANFDKAADRCADQAWNEFGPGARQAVTDYSDLVNALAPYRKEIDAELAPDLPAKMFDCMAERGYRAPDREAFLKTPRHQLFGVAYGRLDGGAEDAWKPVRKPGTVEIGPAIPVRKYTPTPQESELAVAWFHCGQKTGRTAAQLAAVQEVQQRYVDEHQTWIDELNPVIEELARRASAIGGS